MKKKRVTLTQQTAKIQTLMEIIKSLVSVSSFSVRSAVEASIKKGDEHD
jgi:hypothetical protein